MSILLRSFLKTLLIFVAVGGGFALLAFLATSFPLALGTVVIFLVVLLSFVKIWSGIYEEEDFKKDLW